MMPSAFCGYERSDGALGGVGQHLMFSSAAVQHVAGLFSACAGTPLRMAVQARVSTPMGCW